MIKRNPSIHHVWCSACSYHRFQPQACHWTCDMELVIKDTACTGFIARRLKVSFNKGSTVRREDGTHLRKSLERELSKHPLN